MDLPLLDKNLIADFVHITDREATQTARDSVKGKR